MENDKPSDEDPPGSPGAPPSRLRDMARAIISGVTRIKPVLESVAIVLAGGWFIGQCTLGDFTPAADLSVEVVGRAGDPRDPTMDEVFVRATFKQVRAMVDLFDAYTYALGGGPSDPLPCVGFPPFDKHGEKSLYVTSGDVLSFACTARIARDRCGVLEVKVEGQRMFHLIRSWRAPGRWGKSSWQAAAPACPEKKR